jgi:hypothetical protein
MQKNSHIIRWKKLVAHRCEHALVEFKIRSNHTNGVQFQLFTGSALDRSTVKPAQFQLSMPSSCSSPLELLFEIAIVFADGYQNSQ